MMNMMKMIGFGQDKNTMYLTVKKSKLFLKDFEMFLCAEFNMYFSVSSDKVKSKKQLEDINKMIDYHKAYTFIDARVDLFFGKDNVFVIFTNLDKKQILNLKKKLKDYFEMIK